MIKRLAAVGAASLAAGTVLFAATPAMANDPQFASQSCEGADGGNGLIGLNLLNPTFCDQEINQLSFESDGHGFGHHGHHGHHGWHPGWHRGHAHGLGGHGHVHGHWYKQGQQSSSEQSGYALQGSLRTR